MWQSFSAMPDDTMKRSEDTAVHFSTFALSGNNGSILWHHLPGDFEQSDDDVIEIVISLYIHFKPMVTLQVFF